jgi:Protein of unknown function (DUF402)
MTNARGPTTLARGSHVRVTLLKRRHPDVEYEAVVAQDDGNQIVVSAEWSEEAPRDLGYVRFETGDRFKEHYWRDRWYSVKEVRDAGGTLKGWYCDVARPVRVEEERLVSEDLELDLWVSADGRTILRLDEEDFVASGMTEADPLAEAQARLALDALERLARDGFSGIATPDRPEPQ